MSFNGPPDRRFSVSSLSTYDGQSSGAPSRRASVFCNGVSNKPISLKWSNYSVDSTPTALAKETGTKRWDGATRESSEWGALKKDAELWSEDGDCLVYLYGQSQSRRGPAFKVSLKALEDANCGPLLNRFMAQPLPETPDSLVSNNSNSERLYYDISAEQEICQLYIPAPRSAGRDDAYLYHIATRNFFAWICGKPLVGSHVGGALVGLLNSMNEFRSYGDDNVQDMMDYMDEQGYGDVRNSPDHALGLLFFAEYFHFKDLWINAFAHCTGMHNRLPSSPGFDFMSTTSRALITRSSFEMDIRLDTAGRMLGNFLSDELSDAHLGLSSGARIHLDKFQSFLYSYHVKKLGYYPPSISGSETEAMPRSTFAIMYSEFTMLYAYLVDSKSTYSDAISVSQHGGTCVLQSVQSFDSRNRFTALLHPLPLLPEGEDIPPSKHYWRSSRSGKPDREQKPITFAEMKKATNSTDKELEKCTLVRAYRGFERDCILSRDKDDLKISQREGRRVRWILIYCILQTLRSVTDVPEEVRDTHNVPYNLCVQTAGCPPWKQDSREISILRTQAEFTKADFVTLLAKTTPPVTPDGIKPDIDYFAIAHRVTSPRPRSLRSSSVQLSRKGTIRRALSNLGNLPELAHPQPNRPLFHEILVHGYGNGTNKAIVKPPSPPPQMDDGKRASISSCWSDSSSEASSRRSSASNYSVMDVLENSVMPLMVRRSSSVYDNSLSLESLTPVPLKLNGKKVKEEKMIWEDKGYGEWVPTVNA